LAISMEDANLHGGWLTAWGRPGMGAQFRLTLPRRAGAILEASPLPMVPRDLVGPDGVRLEARDMPPASPEASIAGIRSELLASDGSIVHGAADEDTPLGSAATSTTPLTSVASIADEGASEPASGRR
jgi:two-component system, OmpR family, sensor histidine kinase MtrB